jgi:hypothetical protein
MLSRDFERKQTKVRELVLPSGQTVFLSKGKTKSKPKERRKSRLKENAENSTTFNLCKEILFDLIERKLFPLDWYKKQLESRDPMPLKSIFEAKDFESFKQQIFQFLFRLESMDKKWKLSHPDKTQRPRFVCSLKATQSQLERSRKVVKLVLLAQDLEGFEEKDESKETPRAIAEEIQRTCGKLGIPCVSNLCSRRKLAKVIHRKGKVSAVAVIDSSGADDLFKGIKDSYSKLF